MSNTDKITRAANTGSTLQLVTFLRPYLVVKNWTVAINPTEKSSVMYKIVGMIRNIRLLQSAPSNGKSVRRDRPNKTIGIVKSINNTRALAEAITTDTGSRSILLMYTQ